MVLHSSVRALNSDDMKTTKNAETGKSKTV